jgi:hypothetical protein
MISVLGDQPITRTVTAMHMRTHMVVIAPDGSRHTVTRVDHFPYIAVGIGTDTGLSFEVPWEEAKTAQYDVEA